MTAPSFRKVLKSLKCESEMNSAPSPGWRINEQGAWVRETIHRMDRRCRNWDYCGTGTYLITLVLNDRRRPILGEVVGPPAEMRPSELGAAIVAHARRLPEFTPEIKVLGVQLMPDHLHVVLQVVRRMAKPLGERLRGFKIGCTKLARAAGGQGINAQERGAAARGKGLFADGFVDTILFDATAVQKGLAYLADNPRRLWEKRSYPELFRVLRDLQVEMTLGGKPGIGHFAAIGNQYLLQQPALLQVQCSRSDFAYARDAAGAPLKNRPPAVCTAKFCDKVEELLSAAAHGAVLISPCISQGEKEIARRAFMAGHKVIALQNKGFSPLYKPGGQSFDTCAAGNLLMLAPAAWPFTPVRRPITRMDACALNHVAQLLAGEGAAEINYRGMRPLDVERLAAQAVCWEPCK